MWGSTLLSEQRTRIIILPPTNMEPGLVEQHSPRPLVEALLADGKRN